MSSHPRVAVTSCGPKGYRRNTAAALEPRKLLMVLVPLLSLPPWLRRTSPELSRQHST
jgi:hypothetical protein